MNIAIVSFLVLFVSIPPAMSEYSEPQSGSTIYVATTGSDETGDGSEEHPYKTIQKGIDVAINGDTVHVASGTYTGAGNVNLDFKGKVITVRSENGPDDCAVDCQGISGNRGFYFHSGEGPDSILEGFTIRNGCFDKFSPPPIFGAGILCSNGSSPTIRENIVMGNWEGNLCWGGGIYCSYDSSPLIVGNIITGNATKTRTTAGQGGAGISCHGASPEIMRKHFRMQSETYICETLDT